MTAFMKDGKAFVKNASGRITDIPTSQLEIYVAQGYRPASEDEVRAVPTFRHVFDGNYGSNAKIDPDTLTAMNRLQAGQVAQIAERLRDGSNLQHGELLLGAEPHPPMTSRTNDGFPRLQEAGASHAAIHNSAQPAAPTLQRGIAPDSLREAVGRVNVSGQLKDPEQAIADGDVQVRVAAPIQTVLVSQAQVAGDAAASVAAARAAVPGSTLAGGTVSTTLEGGGTVLVSNPAATAVDYSATLAAVAVASAQAGERAEQQKKDTEQAVEAGRQAVRDLGDSGQSEPLTMQEANQQAVESMGKADLKPQADVIATHTPPQADSGESSSQPKATALSVDTPYKADDELPSNTPGYSKLQADGRIKTVADLKEFDFSKDKISGVADKTVSEIEAFRNGLKVE